MRPPVLFFTFANNPDNPLPDLQEEDRLIYEAISPFAIKHRFFIHRDQNTTAQGIINSLREFGNSVSIFHFAGHANSSNLYLTDQPASGKGLSQMLALQKPIRLVFLNGCNTSGFIQQLLTLGIPAVIATTREVNDTTALKLAEYFYGSLCKGASIAESFDFARGAIQTDVTSNRKISRGLVLPETVSADFPWGLYSKEEKSLNWKLENATEDINPGPSHLWLRIAMLVLPILILYSWSIIHFRFNSLTIYLTIVVIFSGGLFLFDKFFGHRFRGIQHRFKTIKNASLNTFFIVALWLSVSGLIATIPNPTLLIRLPVDQFQKQFHRRLRVLRNGELYYFKPDSVSPSSLLGKQKININENTITKWKQELEHEHIAPGLQDRVIDIWRTIPTNDTLKLLHIGDQVTIQLLTLEDSIITARDTQITKRFTDVLLKKF